MAKGAICLCSPTNDQENFKLEHFTLHDTQKVCKKCYWFRNFILSISDVPENSDCSMAEDKTLRNNIKNVESKHDIFKYTPK